MKRILPKQVEMLGRSQEIGLEEVVAAARSKKSWSQQELARQSHVSPRTIINIEIGKQKRYRQDVIVRLAKALGEDPYLWLRLAGHGEIPKEKVERFLRESGGMKFVGEIEPKEVIQNLEERLNIQPALICISYPSIPSAIQLEVQQTFARLFNKGLWVAVTCPFPQIPNFERDKHASLARYYREVYGNIVEFARELRNYIDEDKKDHLAVFVPKMHEDIHYVMPIVGISEYRPTLTKYFQGNGGESEEFTLSAWVTLTQEHRDRWFRIYPLDVSETESMVRYQKFLCWRDYFSEILAHCDPKNQKAWNKKDFDGPKCDWRMVDLG